MTHIADIVNRTNAEGARCKSCKNPVVIARFQCAFRLRDMVLVETMPALTHCPVMNRLSAFSYYAPNGARGFVLSGFYQYYAPNGAAL